MSAAWYSILTISVVSLIISESFCGPPSYKYDYRRNNKKNQASPGIYFDPESGQFKRGDPPVDLLVKSQQLREEVKQSKNQGSNSAEFDSGFFHHLPFAKFSSIGAESEDNRWVVQNNFALRHLTAKIRWILQLLFGVYFLGRKFWRTASRTSRIPQDLNFKKPPTLFTTTLTTLHKSY